ncbi:MAG: ABC transporter permease [Tropicimonas sp.]|uniref:ABC transporter permease n=1 Tax=Tropicimonas sp. TaxID=2067044 RepID=UPI003A892714
MRRFILIRLAAALPTLLGMSLVAFFIVALAPGDPVLMELRSMGIVPKAEEIEAIRAGYGFDKPLALRYLDWLGRAVRLDFGISISTGRPVIDEIALYLPATLLLALSGLCGAIAISLALGVLAALSGRGVRAVLRLGTILLVSVPAFWLALLLIHAFVLHLGWARLLGGGSLRDLVLPALTLSLAGGAALGRFVFERVRAEQSEDYVRLAIAKGIGPLGILAGHIAPRVIGPLVTSWTMTFGSLLGGSVIVEAVFSWPGLGQLILQSIAERDFPVIQAYLVLMGLIFVTTSLVADIVVVLADPQLRRQVSHD